MKKFLSYSLILVVLLLASLSEAEAQRFNRRNLYSSVGVSLNAMNYFGDVTPESDFTSLRLSSTRPSLSVHYTQKFTPRIYGRAALSWGRITGDDSKSADFNEPENEPRYKRNLSFRNDIKELNVVGIIDLFENRRTFLRRPDFTPYAFAGVAVFHHNPKAYYDGRDSRVPAGWYELQPLGTEGQNSDAADYPDPYSKVQFAIPFGLGVKYKLARNWDVAFEVTWRKTFTDYLDDVSTTYANKADLNTTAAILSDRSADNGRAASYNPQTDANGFKYIPGYGLPGDQRGDATDDDWYISTGFSLNYILTPVRRGPKFR
jgi:opacity protein-like surface antigen